MPSGIFVVHTTQQAQEAGALVDLLETALALPDGAIACSHLPGYAWGGGSANGAAWEAMLARVGATIALADRDALASPQWMFDLGAAFGRGLWTVVLIDDATLATRLPTQLASATLALRGDSSSLRSVIEDLAFELGLPPRMGKDTRDAIQSLSSIPPTALGVSGSQPAPATPASRPVSARPSNATSARLDELLASRQASVREASHEAAPYEALGTPAREEVSFREASVEELLAGDGGLGLDEPLRDAVSRDEASFAGLSHDAIARELEPSSDGEETRVAPAEQPSETTRTAVRVEVPKVLSEPEPELELEPEPEYESLETVPPPVFGSHPSEPPAPFALDDAGLEPIENTDGQVLMSRVHGVSCSLAFDAGRAMGECSFHRDSGGDFASELASTFGRFIDAVGGDWSALSRLGDVEVWLGATDNLLDALPPGGRYLSDWYELGYQLSTLLGIAEGGVLDDPSEREAYLELWAQSIEQLGRSGQAVHVPEGELDRVRAQLENLVGPELSRDYRNVSGVLSSLRELATHNDGPGRPQSLRAG